jgi:hypothetical protein
MLDFMKDQKRFKIIKDFLMPNYQKINVARLQHLESLGLDLNNKKVIEFGAGIGDHTIFYLFKNCEILPTEGRKDLCDFISDRFGIKTLKIDVEKELELLKTLPHFDIIHCYGLLYHINNPAEFIEKIKSIGDVLLLETCVSSQDGLKECRVQEDAKNNTQAVSGVGCRPSRSWLFDCLKQNFEYVYLPHTQPKHPQFPLSWSKEKMGTDKLTRCVFVASNKPLSNENFCDHLLSEYRTW